MAKVVKVRASVRNGRTVKAHVRTITTKPATSGKEYEGVQEDLRYFVSMYNKDPRGIKHWIGNLFHQDPEAFKKFQAYYNEKDSGRIKTRIQRWLKKTVKF